MSAQSSASLAIYATESQNGYSGQLHESLPSAHKKKKKSACEVPLSTMLSNHHIQRGSVIPQCYQIITHGFLKGTLFKFIKGTHTGYAC